MSRWGGEKTMGFIKCYREHDCLWDTSSPLYKNNVARENAYFSLLQSFNDGNLTIKTLKIKIKNLRTTYHQELNKIKESLRHADKSEVYRPTINWFDEMHSFLGPTVSTDAILPISTEYLQFDRTTSEYESHSDEQSVSNSDEQSVSYSQFKKMAEESSPNDRESPVKKKIKLVTNQMPPHRKREHEDTNPQLSDSLNQIDYVTSVVNNPGPSEDEFYYFGMNVAAQLRRLPLHVALQLQAEFQHKLYLARSGPSRL